MDYKNPTIFERMRRLPFVVHYLVARETVERKGDINLALGILNNYLDIAETYDSVSDADKQRVERISQELKEIAEIRKRRESESKLPNLCTQESGE